MEGVSGFIARVREWYRGKKVPAGPGVYSHGLLFFQRERYEQPPLAKALRAIGHFCLKHWQWIFGIVVIPLLIAFWVS